MKSKTQERKPAEVRRFEILHAAKELFTKRGFFSVSMDEVAAKVGISKAAVYLYFKSKTELFLGMVHQGIDKLFSEMESVFLDPANDTFEKKLRAANKAQQKYAPIFKTTQELLNTGLPDGEFPPKIVSEFMRNIHVRRERILELLTNLFAQAQRQGEVRDDLSARELARVFGVYGMLMSRSEISYETAREILFSGILAKKDK